MEKEAFKIKTTETYNVFVSDGNRLTNYDHNGDATLAEVFKLRKYKWMRGSVIVNGVNVPDDAIRWTLDLLQRNSLGTAKKPYTTYMKVTCKTPDSDKSKKRREPVEEEESDDVC